MDFTETLRPKGVYFFRLKVYKREGLYDLSYRTGLGKLLLPCGMKILRVLIFAYFAD